MVDSAPAILVTGATGARGNQGGGAARALLARNVKVHVLARNPEGAAAKELTSLGAIVFKGDLYEPATIAKAIQGCTGVFINVQPDFAKPDGEFEAAKNLIEAAKSAGVQHIIYTSVVGCGQTLDPPPSGFFASYWASKNGIETAVKESGVATWTLLRPATFMTNYLVASAKWMFPELPTEGVLATSYDPDTILTLVDPADVGKFAAAAFADPVRFGGREIEIGVEWVNQEELCGIMSKALGRTVKSKIQSEEESASPLIAKGQVYLSAIGGQKVDLDEVMGWGIPLNTFENFLKANKDSVFEPVA